MPNIKLHPGQTHEHEINVISAYLLGTGDGGINNVEQNRQLAGSILHYRSRATVDSPTRKRGYDIVDADSAYLQNSVVRAGAHCEATRIEGDTSIPGQPVVGELSMLDAARPHLFNWLSLSKAAQGQTTDTFRTIAEPRTLATNPDNVAAWVTATQIQTITMRGVSEPGDEDLASSERMLQMLLEGRVRELGDQERKTLLQDYVESQAMRTESSRIAKADECLGELIDDPRSDAIADLGQKGRDVKFRVQPFNQLAGVLKDRQRDKDDPTPFIQARQGLNFQRNNNYLLEPVRSLTRITGRKLSDADPETTAQAIDARLEMLESVELGGPYDELRDQIVGHMEQLKVARTAKDLKRVKSIAKATKYLTVRCCLPGDTEAIDTWYGARF
jgi:hypothetical protein